MLIPETTITELDLLEMLECSKCKTLQEMCHLQEQRANSLQGTVKYLLDLIESCGDSKCHRLLHGTYVEHDSVNNTPQNHADTLPHNSNSTCLFDSISSTADFNHIANDTSWEEIECTPEFTTNFPVTIINHAKTGHSEERDVLSLQSENTSQGDSAQPDCENTLCDDRDDLSSCSKEIIAINEAHQSNQIIQNTGDADVDTDYNLHVYPFTKFYGHPFFYFDIKALESSTNFELLNSRYVSYYGEFKYEYGGVLHPPRPISANPYLSTLCSYMKIVKPNVNFNSALITKYENGSQFIPFHADNETSIVEGSEIISISLGASREMLFKNVTTGEQESVYLNHGDLLFMTTASQQHFEHSITRNNNCHDMRLNITLRLLCAMKDKKNVPNSEFEPSVIDLNNNTQETLKSKSDVLYISSSMFKGLDEAKLSSRCQTAHVFSYSGKDTGGILDCFTHDSKFTDITPTNVSTIFIMCGTNDVQSIYFNNKQMADTMDEVEKMMHYLKQRFPQAIIYFINLFPRVNKGCNDIVSELNNRFYKISEKQDRVNFINTHNIFSFRGVKRKHLFALYGKDNVHLNRFGVVKFANHMKYISHNPDSTS